MIDVVFFLLVFSTGDIPVRAGDSVVTDSRGLPIASDTQLQGGAIFRVIPVRKGGA